MGRAALVALKALQSEALSLLCVRVAVAVLALGGVGGCASTDDRDDAAIAGRAAHAALLLDRGAEALALGEWDEARRAYAAAAGAGADGFAAKRGLAEAELGAGRPQAALRWYEALAAEDSARFARELEAGYCAALSDGLAELLARHSSGGDASARRALEARPEGAPCARRPELRGAALETWLRAAAAAEARGEPAGAEEAFARARASAPESPRPARQQARMLLRSGQAGRAIELLDEALARHRGDPELRALMVEALSAAGRPGGR